MNVVTCDYIIIGSGFAGIGLKYKLMGRTILIDEKPFKYKIGESHVPNLLKEDPGLISLIPKIARMKSFTRKLGTVFCDSYHGKYATNFPTALGTPFAFHCEREEIERLLAKELSVEIRTEKVIDIDLSKNVVVTDRNRYRFTKYLLDCSGPAKIIANKLGIVTPVEQFNGMKAQWSYWAIDKINKDVDSWAQWTVINKIGPDSWTWQIPIYNSSILSMGLLHRGELLSNEDFFKYIEKYSAACYQLTSIAKNPDRAIKPYMKEVHSRLQYAQRSKKSSGKNWILVGDAYCFADPVYSTGSGVAMLEAITIADILNKNKGKFDHDWYEANCSALLKTVISGIETWYSGAAFNKKVNQEINRTILQGGFSSHFQPSIITDQARKIQLDNVEIFSPSDLSAGPSAIEPQKADIKLYYFDRKAFSRIKNALVIGSGSKPVRITHRVVQKVFEKHVIGKKLSFNDLYLIGELNLFTLKDRIYFGNVIRLIELMGSKNNLTDRLYYFYPDRYEMVSGQLKFGDQYSHVIFKAPSTIEFLENIKGEILFGSELLKLAGKSRNAQILKDMKVFLEKFHRLNIFGQNFLFYGV